MSFSAEVKEELAGHIPSARHCLLAELAADLSFAGQYGQNAEGKFSIGFQIENENVLRKCFTLLKKAYNISDSFQIEHDVMEGIFQKYGDLKGAMSPLLVKNACCKRAFLRGAFLCVGSISDPSKGYHMEFVCTDEEKAEQLRQLIGDYGIEAKIVLRKKYHVVYIKESEAIVDLLNIMEAHIALMKLENLRILKDMRNSVNRKVNCETANITKTVNAASRQIEDILFLKEHYGFQNLPPQLEEIAEVRLELPEAPLKELGENLDPPVGKSGVNHRLRKLSEMAEKLRTEMGIHVEE